MFALPAAVGIYVAVEAVDSRRGLTAWRYLFAGSHAAAERAAVHYSLIRTRAQHHVAPLPYLADVILRVTHETPIEDLLPDRCQATYGAPKGE